MNLDVWVIYLNNCVCRLYDAIYTFLWLASLWLYTIMLIRFGCYWTCWKTWNELICRFTCLPCITCIWCTTLKLVLWMLIVVIYLWICGINLGKWLWLMPCVSILKEGLHQAWSASESSSKAWQCVIKICFLMAFCFCNRGNSSCHPSWDCEKEEELGQITLGLILLGVHTHQSHFYRVKCFCHG